MQIHLHATQLEIVFPTYNQGLLVFSLFGLYAHDVMLKKKSPFSPRLEGKC